MFRSGLTTISALLLAMLPMTVLAEGEDAAILFVQSQGAALMEEPAFGAETLGRLDRGLEVTVMEAEGSWRRIRSEGKEGWVPALILRETPPTQRASHLDGAAEMDAGARRRASAVTTAGAIRGVEEDDRLLDDPNLNVEALHRMEALSVSGDEALKFMLEADGEDEG